MSFGVQFFSSGDESGNKETLKDLIKYVTEDRKMSASKNSDSENT